MAITAYKTFAAFEVLTASDLNASFSQIINNPIDLWSPMTKNAAAGGFKFTGLGVGGAAGEALTYGAEAFVIGTTLAGTLTINGTAVSIPNGLNFDSNTLVINAATNTVAVGVAAAGSGTVLQVGGTIRASENSGGAILLEDLDQADGSRPFWYLQSNAGELLIVSANRSGTGTTGSASRFICDTSNNFKPAANNAQSCGTAALQWSDVRSVLLTISGASTFTGAATFNGAVTLGDAAGDTITVTGTPAGQVVGTVYTPSISATSNVAASTVRDLNYIRVGDRVFVAGAIDIDPTSATTLTTFELSLPVASNLAFTYQLAGAGAVAPTAAVEIVAKVSGNATNDTAAFSFTTGAVVSNQTVSFTFGYPII
jgi:hypothetical protein